MSESTDKRAAEAEADVAPLPDVADLVAQGDAEALLGLARAYRAGSDGATRDLKKCFECYAAAAQLGSAEGEYSVAVFHLSGGVVTQDLKRGAAYLRTAAENGSLPAKVYLANLYELGIEYAASSEKADVWYRSAARAAGIDDDPRSDAYREKMAELGCARHCLALAEVATSDEDRERWLGKARAYGYGLKLKQERALRASQAPVSAAPPALEAGATEAPVAAKAAVVKKHEPNLVITATKRSADPSVRRFRPEALTAFLYAAFFAALALGAGILGAAGARELIAQGKHLPLVDGHPERVHIAAFVLLCVLPAFLVYRGGAVLRAVLVAALGAGVGYAVWGTTHGTLFSVHVTQALAFGAGSFLLGLLVLGLMGGAKPRRRGRN